MAIQYYMRGWNGSAYVDWVVNDQPDSTGLFAPGPVTNITINRVVTSKVDNFLNPYQSTTITSGSNGATLPQAVINVTSTALFQEAGFIYVNSSAGWQQVTYTGITTTSFTGCSGGTGTLSTGGYVLSQPVITSPDSPLVYQNVLDPFLIHVNSYDWLNPINPGVSNLPPFPTGLAAVRGVGQEYASLVWNEATGQWFFAFLNTNGTIGAPLGVSMGALDIDGPLNIQDGYIAVSPSLDASVPPATTGIIRVPNNQSDSTGNTGAIKARDATDANDISLVQADANNDVVVGDGTHNVHVPLDLRVDGFITANFDPTSSTATSQTGFIRNRNNTNIITALTTGNANMMLLGTDSSNHILHGAASGPTNAGQIFNTSSGSEYLFEVNTVGIIHIGANYLSFDSTNSNPLISQNTTTVLNVTGQALTIQAQNSTNGVTTGGAINLTSGTGTSIAGNVNIQTGGTTRFIFTPSSTIQETATHAFGGTADLTSVANPTIKQNDLTVGTTGNALTIQAQNTTAASSTGGALKLTSGSGTTQAGQVLVYTGGTGTNAAIVVSPVNLPAMSFPTTTGKVVITGNLEVQGTTTTVDSTTVDIVGRLLHANWSDPSISPNVAVPSQITGYSVHRGNISGVGRDGAAWIWTEGTQSSGADGYWRAQTVPGDGYASDGYTASNSVNSLSVMANNFSATVDPNPVAGTLPATGGLRTPNNVISVAARNLSVTTTITSGSNLVSLPTGTINVNSTTGFTSSGTLLIATPGGTFATVTYTGTSGGTQFTGCSGGSGVLHTGAYVAQTNASTTVAAGSNNVNLSTATTLNVATTVGFPASGTLRVASTGGIQNVTYTGINSSTQFAITAGTGIGTIFTGNSVVLQPIIGNNDLLLLGTDFANHILHGATNNTGHIFNVPTSPASPLPQYIYDFQVNNVSQIQLANTDYDADGYAETVQVSPTVSNPRFYQLVQPDTGANAGFNFMLQAQAGQQQTGSNANNNGGSLILSSGPAGTGGSGAAGSNGIVQVNIGSTSTAVFNSVDPDGDGYVEWLAAGSSINSPRIYQVTQLGTGANNGFPMMIQAQFGQQQTGVTTNNNGGWLTLASGRAGTGGSGAAGKDGYVEVLTGSTWKMRIFPTTAINAADSNSIIYFENLFRVDTQQTNPLFRQDDTTINSATGQTYTIQAQNATGTTSNGGPLTLTSGTGTTAAGNVNISTGGTTRVIVHPTFTEFRDSAEALRITPVSAGTTQITYASTDTAAQINQTTTASATGAAMTVQAQNAATTGGALVLTSGTGGTTAGNVQIQTGATDRVIVHPTFTEFRDSAEALRITPVSAGTTQITFAATDTAAQINQSSTSTAAASMTIQSQVTTGNTLVGGNLNLIAGNSTGTTTLGGDGYFSSGTGTTQAGNIHLQTGGTDRVIVHPTFTEYRDSAEAYRITPVSSGTTVLQFASTVTAATMKQADLTTNSGTGATLTIQAQNETGTTSNGGPLVLTSGTGTTAAGNVNIQTGGTTRVSVNPTFTTFSDNAEAFRITPVSAGTTVLQFASTDTAATLKQADLTTNSGTGATMTIQAQNETGTTSNGGVLALTSGTGTTAAGNVNIQTGGTTRVSVNPTFTTFSDSAEAFRITPVSAGTTVLQFASTDTAATIKQADLTTNSGTGAAMTIQSQNETGTTSVGGALNLTTGTGTTSAGLLNINIGSTLTATFNSVDPDADGYAEWLAIGTGVTAPRLYQATLAGTGVNPGNTFKINAQAGQQQTSTNANNNGGNLVLASGAAGTGGSGAAGVDGYVLIVNGTTRSATFNATDWDADGYAEWLYAGATLSAPRLYQDTQSGTGANNGFNFKINAQAGQQQTGSNANNNGGTLVLASGLAGTGGSGAAGVDGYILLQNGSTTTATFYESDIDADGYAEWLSVGPTINTPRLYQGTRTGTGANNGFNFRIAAQNGQTQTGVTANNNGGNLVLAAGAAGFGGSGAAGIPGNIQLQLGSTAWGSFGQAGFQQAPVSVPITTGTATLSSAQYAFGYIVLTGSLSGSVTVVFPAIAGATWIVDATQVTLNANTITLQANSNNWGTTIGTSSLYRVTYGGTGASGKLFGTTLSA